MEYTKSFCTHCKDVTNHIFKFNIKLHKAIIPKVVECLCCGHKHASAW